MKRVGTTALDRVNSVISVVLREATLTISVSKSESVSIEPEKVVYLCEAETSDIQRLKIFRSRNH